MKSIANKIILFIFITWFFFLLGYIYYMNIPIKYTQFDAPALAKMCYETNTIDINSKWSGQNVAVKGVVSEINIDKLEHKCYVVLSGDKYPQIICEMLTPNVGFKKGDCVNLAGKFKEARAWVEITKCYIVKD